MPSNPAKRVKLATTSSPGRANDVANDQLSTKDWTTRDLSKPTAVMADRNVKEEEVGILQYVNTSNPGFTGILKQRYTDFLVNEIMLDGTVVHLTDISLPKPVQALEKGDNSAANSHVDPKENTTTALTDVAEKEKASDVKVNRGEVTMKEKNGDQGDVKAEEEAAEDVKTEADDSVETTKDNTQKATKVIAEDSSVVENKSPISDADNELLMTYFGVEVRDSILALYKKVLERPDGKAASYGTVTTQPIGDRQLRTQIHQNVRRIFNSKFETSSNTDTTMKVAVAGKFTRAGAGQNAYNSRPTNRGQMKGKIGWAELGGEHLHFSLFKENKDTMEVISYMASQIHVPPKNFAFAGTKDRRGVTVQRVSLHRGEAKRLLGMNRLLRGSMVGNFKYEKNCLSLGELHGNEFVITLRDCHFADEESSDEHTRLATATRVVEQAVKNMSEHGFLNYFGLQRFGSFSTGTHEVGRLILKGDFRNAVRAILNFNPEILEVDGETDNEKFGRDDIARAVAIDLFENSNHEAALRKMPRKFSAETAILGWLRGERQNDYLGALRSINRGLRLMYVHAYQSFVWNRVVSERWTRFGNKVVEGDLVLVESSPSKEADLRGDAVDVDENGEIIVKPAADDTAVALEDQFERARPLSKEEALSGKYSIFDVILPTPGFDIEYPKNEIGEFYKEFMASEEGGHLDPADMRRPHKDFSLSGSYRKMMALAKDVFVEVKLYSDPLEQLVETDLDRFYKTNPRLLPPPRYPQQHTQPQGNNSWANFQGNLKESDKAIAEAAKARIAAAALEPSKVAPKIEDSFIETSSTTGQRTGHRNIVTLEFKRPAALAGRESDAEATGPSAPEDIPLPDTPKPMVQDDPMTRKRSADQINTDTPNAKKEAEAEPKAEVLPNASEAVEGDKMVLDIPPLPKKVAVIFKCKLGSSQYATMALRELMKTGGVREYKSGFSGR